MGKRLGKIMVLLFCVCPVMRAKAFQVRRMETVPFGEILTKASSEFPGFEAVETINGSGLKNHEHQSQNLGRSMWLSAISTNETRAAAGTHKGIAWIMFSFKNTKNIDLIEIWNHNQDNHLNRGLQKVYIQYSSDGKNWKYLKQGDTDYTIIPRSSGSKKMPPSLSISTSGLAFKYLCITADAKHGNFYHDGTKRTLDEAAIKNQNVDYYGLSEVRFYQERLVDSSQLPSITNASIEVGQGYRKTNVGPRREGRITFENPIFTGGEITLKVNGKTVTDSIPTSKIGVYEHELLLPKGYMNYEALMDIHFSSAQGSFEKEVKVLPARKWEVYFLPHSHLDIGYTHAHEDVMGRQLRNIDYALELVEKTSDFPVESRFKWNIETTWPLIEYVKRNQGSKKLDDFWRAVKAGSISINASIGNILTGLSTREELMHLFDDGISLASAKNIPVNTVMMSDVPGFSWGLITAMAQNGIRYFSMAPNYVPFLQNGGSRVGLAHIEWADRPFYWQSQSGDEKVLCWSAGTGYSFFHDWLAGKLSAGGVEPIWKRLQQLEEADFPYNTTYFRYTVNGDNGPPDEEMSSIIKQWNDTYASPHFVIGTTQELFSHFEKEYGEHLPSYKGDLTPYWEDGAASTARELAMNRKNSNLLNQLEILYTLMDKENFPFQDFQAAWRNITLFSEHTWGASASGPSPEAEMTKLLWKQKQVFAFNADSLVRKITLGLHQKLNDKEQSQYITVFNTNTWSRSDVVKVDDVKNLENKQLISKTDTASLQKIDDSWFFIARDVPALSAKSYRIVKGNTQVSLGQSSGEGKSIENEYLKLQLKEDGSIDKLIEKKENHDFASVDGLNRYIHTGRNAVGPKYVDSVSTKINRGPVATILTATSRPAGTHSLLQEYILYKHLNKLYIKNTLDKTADYDFENERFEFDFAIENPETEIDLPFSTVRPEREQLSGANKNFFSSQNGVTITGLKHSVSLNMAQEPILELADLTGEAWMKDRKEYLAWKRQTSSSARVYSWVMNNSWRTNYKASQPGMATFAYTIQPLGRDSAEGKKTLLEDAQPLLAFATRDRVEVKVPFALSENNQLAISTMRPALDGKGIILRLINLSNRTLHNGLKYKSFTPSRVTECTNQEKEIQQKDGGDFWMKPHATKTFKLWF